MQIAGVAAFNKKDREILKKELQKRFFYFCKNHPLDDLQEMILFAKHAKCREM